MAMDKSDKKEQQMYEAEDDVRTLSRAAEIRGDKERFGRAVKMAKTKLKELKVIAEGEDMDEDDA